jgi:hypothetical protein
MNSSSSKLLKTSKEPSSPLVSYDQKNHSTPTLRVNLRSRQMSTMHITNNPFELAALTKKNQELNIEYVSNATLISNDDFEMIIYGALNTTR